MFHLLRVFKFEASLQPEDEVVLPFEDLPEDRDLRKELEVSGRDLEVFEVQEPQVVLNIRQFREQPEKE